MRTVFRHLHTVQIVLLHIGHSPCLAILCASHGEFHVLHVYVLHIAEVHAPNREYGPLVCRTVLEITISRCVGGALAKLALRQLGVSINAYTSQVGDVALDRDYTKYNFAEIEHNPVRCPDPIAAQRMEQLISEVKAEGDTIGGVVTCVVKNCPKGIGEPEFGKLHAMLGAAMLSINAAKGFEYGEGFSCATSRGSRQNDAFVAEGRNIHTSTNHSGGIQGGISNGEDIYFRTAFKPTATILQEQKTVDSTGNSAILQAHGRHDPCVVPRAVPIVEAMTAMVILDYIMLNKHTFL